MTQWECIKDSASGLTLDVTWLNWGLEKCVYAHTVRGIAAWCLTHTHRRKLCVLEQEWRWRASGALWSRWREHKTAFINTQEEKKRLVFNSPWLCQRAPPCVWKRGGKRIGSEMCMCCVWSLSSTNVESVHLCLATRPWLSSCTDARTRAQCD